MKRYITVETAMRQLKLTRPTAVKTLKAVAAQGVGTFKIGRKGWPTRLER